VTDPTPGGFADTPGPQATPEQDADIRALLAFLRDQPLEMPPDVVARLDAVIAEERRTSAGAGTTALSASLDDAEDERPPASVTVLPTHGSRRGPSRRAFAIVGGLAAAAVVVVGGVNLLGGIGGQSSTTSAGSSAAPAVGSVPESALAGSLGTRVSASGTAYSKAALAAQAQALVTDARTARTSSDASTPSAARTPDPIAVPGTATGDSSPGPTRSGATAYGSLSANAVAGCVSSLTGNDGSVAIAVDSGTYEGRPALVVVVPSKDDPTSLDVWVVPPTCSATSSTFFAWQSIPAS
jgi:hypothetical protein